MEIIVVDDSSTDRTAEIVARSLVSNPKLRLVKAGAKPDGWVGKSWPCWRGYEEALNSDYLLFVDADSTFDRTVIELSVLYSEENSIDAFSLSPRVKLHTIWANAVLPLISGAINLLYPMRQVNDRKNERAYVFGTYVLVRKNVYERVGGHMKVRDQLVEDAALARLIKSAGYNLRIERGPDLLTTQWESDLRAIFHGLERIASSSIKTYGLLAILNAVLLFFLIIYPVIFILSVTLFHAFSTTFLVGTVACVLNVLVFLSLSANELYGISGKRGPGILLYVLGGIIFIVAIVTTSIKVAKGKNLYWKGQGYKQAVERPLKT